VRHIPSSQSSNVGIGNLLRARGAGPTRWVIFEDKHVDGREIELDEMLNHSVGREIGTILCCIPGRLAFVESEDGRFILER